MVQTDLFGTRAEFESEALATLDGVVERNDPGHVYALFSGGTDSLCSTHLASRHPRFTGVVHVNTEIGIEATRGFVRSACAAYGWPLTEPYPPRPPFKDRHGQPWGEAGQTAYEALVLRWGFPGPRGHTLMYNRLKERCLARLVRGCGGDRRIVLVTGVRRGESRRRMGHIVAEQRDGRRVWCAPLVNWGDEEKREYRDRYSLPVNDVARRLCMSGECLCGAFARPHELAEIERVSPETAAYIRRLELRVQAAGQVRCRWGEKPARPSKKKAGHGPFLPLCVGCEAKYEEDPD
jgi:3'-phosphoadenosine 5'-phosphosulfate sulfotransferase (PAPS reductase)/FAD synthetase